MARAGLGMTVQQLAEKAGVGASTIARFEAGKGALTTTIEKIETVLAREGVTFLADDGSGPGVRIKGISGGAE